MPTTVIITENNLTVVTASDLLLTFTITDWPDNFQLACTLSSLIDGAVGPSPQLLAHAGAIEAGAMAAALVAEQGVGGGVQEGEGVGARRGWRQGELEEAGGAGVLTVLGQGAVGEGAAPDHVDARAQQQNPEPPTYVGHGVLDLALVGLVAHLVVPHVKGVLLMPLPEQQQPVPRAHTLHSLPVDPPHKLDLHRIHIPQQHGRGGHQQVLTLEPGYCSEAELPYHQCGYVMQVLVVVGHIDQECRHRELTSLDCRSVSHASLGHRLTVVIALLCPYACLSGIVQYSQSTSIVPAQQPYLVAHCHDLTVHYLLWTVPQVRPCIATGIEHPQILQLCAIVHAAIEVDQGGQGGSAGVGAGGRAVREGGQAGLGEGQHEGLGKGEQQRGGGGHGGQGEGGWGQGEDAGAGGWGRQRGEGEGGQRGEHQGDREQVQHGMDLKYKAMENSGGGAESPSGPQLHLEYLQHKLSTKEKRIAELQSLCQQHQQTIQTLTSSLGATQQQLQQTTAQCHSLLSCPRQHPECSLNRVLSKQNHQLITSVSQLKQIIAQYDQTLAEARQAVQRERQRADLAEGLAQDLKAQVEGLLGELRGRARWEEVGRLGRYEGVLEERLWQAQDTQNKENRQSRESDNSQLVGLLKLRVSSLQQQLHSAQSRCKHLQSILLSPR